MRIGLYHGYELIGSGSNEFNRYLAKSLIELGHEVHLICKEDNPAHVFGFENKTHEDLCFLHKLPEEASVKPVYLTDKQRGNNVKAFIDLTDEELFEYIQENQGYLYKILSKYKFDVLLTNHLVCQPYIAIEPCKKTNTPMYIFPHGSAIEYTVKVDDRYKKLALAAIEACNGLIIGNREVRERIINIYPEHKELIEKKTSTVGIGVDTNLFKVVEKKDRRKSIEKIIKKEKLKGKTSSQTEELHRRLEKGELRAVKEYQENYIHKLPDSDIDDHIKSIPWDQKILFFAGALTVGKGLQSLICALPLILKINPDVHLVVVGSGSYREVLEGLVYAISTANKGLLLDLCQNGFDLDRNNLKGCWGCVDFFLKDTKNIAAIFKYGKDLQKRVHFLGRLNHSLLQCVFPCSDLALFPSVVPEAYGLVLSESLSNGVLPLVTYKNGFKDGLDDLVDMLGQDLVEKMKIASDDEHRIVSIITTVR
jgi:glycosyltransferase involved in cell wall biosynthesis